MSNVIIPKGWNAPESSVTPRWAHASRRDIVRGLGLGAMSALGIGCGLSVDGAPSVNGGGAVRNLGDALPAPLHPEFMDAGRPLSARAAATTYNNYYEFTTNKAGVHLLTGDFQIEPWTVEIDGLCHNPGVRSFDDLIRRFPLEERIYRFRCVERWAMTVPWTGFPLAELIADADPMGSAKYVAMQTVDRPSQQPGREDYLSAPWPYHEALRLDEALNPLALMVVGLYGEPLPVQNGAPLRLIVPWKYGYKSTKAVVRITFTETQPPTFWNTLDAHEYGFFSNVNPNKPHPRWSQAEEWLIPGSDRIPTQVYNGYGDWVADLYTGDEH